MESKKVIKIFQKAENEVQSEHGFSEYVETENVTCKTCLTRCVQRDHKNLSQIRAN